MSLPYFPVQFAIIFAFLYRSDACLWLRLPGDDAVPLVMGSLPVQGQYDMVGVLQDFAHAHVAW